MEVSYGWDEVGVETLYFKEPIIEQEKKPDDIMVVQYWSVADVSQVNEWWSEISDSMWQMQAIACACAAHGVGDFLNVLNIGGMGWESLNMFNPNLMNGFELGYEEHEHCKCGGHFKDGKCEKCGAKHNHNH